MRLLYTAVLMASTVAAALSPAPPRIWGATEARAVPGGIEVTFDVMNSGTTRLLTLPRASSQNCEPFLHVRVLRAGTRELVYPTREASLCAQDMVTLTVPAAEVSRSAALPAPAPELKLSRRLNLAPGRYVVEAWIPAGGVEPRVRGTYAVVQVR